MTNNERDHVEVALISVSGEQLAALRLDPQATLSKVMSRVQEEFGYPAESQQLLQQSGGVLEEEELLESLTQPILLSLVLLPFDKAEALFQAARVGHEAAVRSLLLRVAVDQEERRNLLLARTEYRLDTPLVLAAESGHEIVCRALLESASHADVQKEMLAAEDCSRNTALLCAAGKGHEMVCRALPEAAPSVDMRTEMLTFRSASIFLCHTALLRAASFGHENVSRVLLELAPNPELQKEMLLQRDEFGATALLLAVERNHEVACRELLQTAERLEVREEVREEVLAAEDNCGRTALQVSSGVFRFHLGSL